MSDFLTIKQVMAQLGVSRQTVHSLAHQYGWASELVGNKRKYKASDVAATPDETERRRLGYIQRSLDAGIPQWFYAQLEQKWVLVLADGQAAARHLAEKALGELPQVCRLARAAEVDAYADQAGPAQIPADPIVLTERPYYVESPAAWTIVLARSEKDAKEIGGSDVLTGHYIKVCRLATADELAAFDEMFGTKGGE